MAAARTPRVGRAPRTARQGRLMAHSTRRKLAPAPDRAVERVAAEVSRAFEAWAARFVALVVRDLVQVSARFVQDATVRGLFEEAGRATPDPKVLEQAFRMLDTQSADEMRVAGVRTADVVTSAETRQAEWVRQNTDLIKAETDLRRRVERVIADPLNEGRSVADITTMLQEQAGYSKSRAELTARDQTLKVYGQIQEARQRAAGITKYIWTTSLDERVREDHARLDGSVQEWDDPPTVDQRTGRRGHPGSDFQCRCSAVPVLDDESADPQEAQTARAARERAVAEGRFRVPEGPPRERAMQPSRAEMQAAEAQRATEAERVRAEAEAQAAADQRIAEARRAAELERLRAEENARAAAAPVTPVAPGAVVGTDGTVIDIRNLTHAELDADKFRPGVLEALRADPAFVRTGRATVGAARNARSGLDHLQIRQRSPDGVGPLRGEGWFLIDGSHRLQVAREVGLPQLPAIVLNNEGTEIYRGPLPVQPTPQPVDMRPAPVQAREHFSAFKTIDVEDTPEAQAVVQALDAAGLRTLLVDSEGDALEVLKKPIIEKGGRVAGAHTWALKGGGTLRVDLSPDMLKEFTDDRQPLGSKDLWAVASAMSTVEETAQAAALHEYGHMVHRKDFSSALFWDIDKVVTRGGRDNPEHHKDFISEYAASTHNEYFAEAFTAYHMRREWLRVNAPRAFAMVVEVLGMRGML